jgi:hypothetical protein
MSLIRSILPLRPRCFKTQAEVLDHIAKHPKQTGPIKLYNIILRRTDSKKLLEALITAGFTYEHSMKIVKAIKHENIIIRNTHYERAEHIAQIMHQHDNSLKVSITEA